MPAADTCTLALCALAAVPFFVMPADWRFTAALAAAQFLLLLPLVYYSQPVLQCGRKTLFGGVPAMEGLVFVCCVAGIISSVILSINAVHGFISAAAAGFAPLAVLLFTVLVNCYFKQILVPRSLMTALQPIKQRRLCCQQYLPLHLQRR